MNRTQRHLLALDLVKRKIAQSKSALQKGDEARVRSATSKKRTAAAGNGGK